MTDLVRVIYRKFDGSLHWNLTMRRLGEDRHGVWLGAPAFTPLSKGHQPIDPLPHAYVCLVPADPEAWWAATFNAEPRSTEIYVDVTTPMRWNSAAEATCVDLDLDVVRKRGETEARLLDEDEFAEHGKLFGYPPDVVARASGAARWLMTAVAAGTEPFGTAYLPWLAMVA
ncbi:hypothetical protein SRB5_33650 [Streptomyces sp. RB5]|uniref:DUF402 domain-containing protein n=1 Tax=Streptomyces smaragdinus TaxID=2585196 RepID=A0A7K0CJL4_9ACTN|nr:DUF402 domain-containing protein [Streptomyces smaragdinus]MQY13222.1 hypothetical protein [Streptomyces smaragdinus]